nr:FAD synthase [Tanacetum cinerariifolium]
MSDLVFIYGGVGPLHSVVTVGRVDKAFGVRLGSKGLKSSNGAPGKLNSVGPLFWKDSYTLSDVREQTASGVAERTKKTRIRAVKFIGQVVSAENNATLINNSDDNSDEIV